LGERGFSTCDQDLPRVRGVSFCGVFFFHDLCAGRDLEAASRALGVNLLAGQRRDSGRTGRKTDRRRNEFGARVGRKGPGPPTRSIETTAARGGPSKHIPARGIQATEERQGTIGMASAAMAQPMPRRSFGDLIPFINSNTFIENLPFRIHRPGRRQEHLGAPPRLPGNSALGCPGERRFAPRASFPIA